MELELCSNELQKQLHEIGCNIKYCTCGGFPECICDNNIPLHLAQMWFREVHEIDITTALVGMGYGFYIHITRGTTNRGENYGQHYSYNQALSAGLKECCKLIKTN